MEKRNKISICTASRKVLFWTFMWPTEETEFNPSKWYYIRPAVYLIIAVTSISLIVIHLLLSLKFQGLDISEDLAILSEFTGISVTMVIYVIKQKNIALLMRDLSDFDEFGKPPGFDRVNKFLALSTHIVHLYAILGTTVYNTWKLLDRPRCLAERKFQEVCGALISAWTFFDPDHWPVFHLFAAYIFFMCFSAEKAILFSSIQVCELSTNIKLRVDHLNSMLIKCFDKDTAASRKRLIKCIRYHIQIIVSAERLNDCFQYLMFVHLTCTGLIMGFLENNIAKTLAVAPMMHLAGWIFAIFLACYAGQILIDTSVTVAEAAYNSMWYEAEPKIRKDLVLMIMRSQKELHIKTGAFNVLQFQLFVSIMKMSYSFLTLINN